MVGTSDVGREAGVATYCDVSLSFPSFLPQRDTVVAGPPQYLRNYRPGPVTATPILKVGSAADWEDVILRQRRATRGLPKDPGIVPFQNCLESDTVCIVADDRLRRRQHLLKCSLRCPGALHIKVRCSGGTGNSICSVSSTSECLVWSAFCLKK